MGLNPQRIALPAGGSVLAIEQANYVENFQFGIDLPITSVVVGTPRRRQMLGSMLFRPVPVRTINFSYALFGKEGHEVKEAKRGMRSKIQYSDRVIDSASAKLERYSWAALLDVAELANAGAFDAAMNLGLDIQAKQAELARQIVEITVEKELATVALAAASYSAAAPDLDVTVTNSWNAASGDSKADVRAVAKLLAAQHGAQLSDVVAYATDQTWHAIQEDTAWTAIRANTLSGDRAVQLEEVANYWGIGEVVVGDAYESVAGVMTSMYGDVCILRLRLDAATYDLRETQGDSFCNFGINELGVALTPWYAEENTSWVYPWEQWALPATVDTTAAAILRGTAA